MHPRPAPSHHWDGTLRTHRPRRTLAVSHDSPTRLLHCAQTARCPHCANPIDRHATTGPQPVSLHPGELSARLVPAAYRWHLASGVAYPAGDGSPWCRITHLTVCPADRGELALATARDVADLLVQPGVTVLVEEGADGAHCAASLPAWSCSRSRNRTRPASARETRQALGTP